MQHPDIEMIQRYGYKEFPPEIYCDQCDEEINVLTALKYDGYILCCTNCLGQFVLEEGTATKY